MIWNIVIVSIMSLLMIIMIITAKKSKNSSDFFRSSGAMPWWLVGALGFVGQFSSWAFTGAQSEAYKNGMLVAFIFIANFVGFIISAFWMAPRARRMRLATGADAIRQRYGARSTKVITSIRIINSLVAPAIKIIALGIVISIVLHINSILAMIISGFMISIFAALGGIKMLASFSFATTIILMSVTVVSSVYALGAFGGSVLTPGKGLSDGQLKDLGHAFFGSHYGSILTPIAWTLFIFVKQSMSIFSQYNKYIPVKNEKSARKAALMSGILMLGAAIIWFVPSWAMKASGVDPNSWSTASIVGSAKVMDSVYLEYLIKYMPIGFLGILAFSLIISTISSIGSQINGNSANIVRNLRRPKYSYTKELMLSKLTVLIMGILTTGSAILMQSIKGMSLFDIMQVFTTSFGMPITIPIVLGMFFVRKTNDKIIWPVIAIGACVSIFSTLIMNVNMFNSMFGTHLLSTEKPQLMVIMSISLHFLITIPSYLLLAKFWKPNLSEVRKHELNFFWKKMDTPINSDSMEINKEAAETAKNAYGKIIWFVIPLVIFACIPEEKIIYNFAYIFVSLLMICIYLLMRYRAKKEAARVIENPINDEADRIANEKEIEIILKEYVDAKKNNIPHYMDD